MSIGSRVHVAVSRNGRDCSLYVNGQPAAHSISTVSVVYQNAFLVFGMDYKNRSNYFKGTMDRVAIFSQSLTESEIISLYSSEVGAPSSVPTLSFTSIPTPTSSTAVVVNGGGDNGSGNSSECNTGCIIGIVVGFLGFIATCFGIFAVYHIYYLQKK